MHATGFSCCPSATSAKRAISDLAFSAKPHPRSEPLRAPGAFGGKPAMRLFQLGDRKRHHPGRPGTKAQTGRGDRAAGLGRRHSIGSRHRLTCRTETTPSKLQHVRGCARRRDDRVELLQLEASGINGAHPVHIPVILQGARNFGARRLQSKGCFIRQDDALYCVSGEGTLTGGW